MALKSNYNSHPKHPFLIKTKSFIFDQSKPTYVEMDRRKGLAPKRETYQNQIAPHKSRKNNSRIFSNSQHRKKIDDESRD